MKLSGIIDSVISGDWGNDGLSSTSTHPVHCIRSADIVPYYNNIFDEIPIRYITERSFNSRELCEGDIIIEKSGGTNECSTGRPMYVSKELLDVNPELICSNFCCAIRIKDGWDAKYIYYLIRLVHSKGIFHNYEGKTSGIHNLQMDAAFDAIELPDLSYEEQKKISAFLTSIEKKQYVNKKQNDILEKMAKQLYDYWFVQFDFPDENGRPYKSSGGVMVYNPILKRYIPKRWKTDKLMNILDILKDGTHNPPKRIEFGIPLLTGTMFGKNFLEYEKATYISEDDYKQIHKKYSPKQFDVIITKIGTLGNVNVLTRRDIPIAIHCNSALLRFPDNWGNYFPFLMCKSPVFYSRLKAVKGQSIQEFASLDKIGSIYVEVPDDKTMCVFNKKIEPIIQKLMFLREEIIELEKTKNEILPLLMTGQVKLK